VARNLVVITGAGASYDCASEMVDKTQRRPPLVKDLFGTDFADILLQYPLAQAAATDIRRAIGPGAESAIQLEDFLREQMRDAESTYAQRRYKQIPLYLQHVLFEVSKTDGSGYTRDVDNYNALVNGALEFEKVLFLTLNYDTLLDDRLFNYSPLVDMSSYVTADPRWALVKLHGSVNWGRRASRSWDTPGVMGNRLFAEFEYTIEAVNRVIDETPIGGLGNIELRRNEDLPERRFDGKDVYYPALSVPLGSEDEIVCDEAHQSAARGRLKSGDGVHLLVIGYSGLDQEVIKLLRESDASLRTFLVANGSLERSREGAEAIGEAFSGFELGDRNLFDGGFTDLVKSGRLREFFEDARKN
jgi:hypothetical protein